MRKEMTTLTPGRQFVLGALFAGQLNSGINAAGILICLTQNSDWQARARDEVESVAAKYSPGSTLSLPERLAAVPLAAWESEFTVLELCLRESIRIHMVGASFRKNLSGKALRVGEHVVPDGSCLMYHLSDVHMNPDIYPEPLRFDPGRFLPDRAEDKRRPLGYIGWGVGRHPCPGQRFAKLESNVITAFFLAYFDFDFCDEKGTTEGAVPPQVNLNAFSAHKPKEPTFLKLKRRSDVTAA